VLPVPVPVLVPVPVRVRCVGLGLGLGLVHDGRESGATLAAQFESPEAQLLRRLAVLGAVHEHRARRVVHAIGGDTSQMHSRYLAVALGADDQQVSTMRHFGERKCRLSLHQVLLNTDACGVNFYFSKGMIELGLSKFCVVITRSCRREHAGER
jgi:hypothetical protein